MSATSDFWLQRLGGPASAEGFIAETLQSGSSAPVLQGKLTFPVSQADIYNVSGLLKQILPAPVHYFTSILHKDICAHCLLVCFIY